MKPKISIIVPIYNTERFLQDCIDSLLNQTMQEIEIILVNDASPDNCLSIMKKNQEIHPDKIKIIDSKENLKQGGARNLGIHEASGDYIAFVDSDDYIAPDMLKKMYSKIVEERADVCVIKYAAVPEEITYKEMMSDDSQKHILGIAEWKVEKVKKFAGRTLSEKGIEHAIADSGGVWATLWRKSLIVDNSVYFPEYVKFEDDYWAFLIKCYVRRYTYVDDIGYFYRMVATSTMNARNQMYQWDRVTVRKMLLTELKKRDLFYKIFEAVEYTSIITCFDAYFTFMHSFDKPPVKLVRKIPREFLQSFPNWRHNAQYRKKFPKSRRMKYAVIERFPVMMLYIHPIWEKLDKKFKAIRKKYKKC